MHNPPDIVLPSCPDSSTTVHFCGGPLDGQDEDVPADTHELYDHDDPTCHYRYCPHATARLGRIAFIHQHLTHYLYAR